MLNRFRHPLLSLVLVVFLLAGCRSAGEFGTETDQLINHARVTFQSMMKDRQYPGLVDLASRAKAIIIVPSMIRGGFLIGGRGGNAVMLVRGENGTWSPPAFYTLGGLSFGAQIGLNTSELIITVMTEKGLNAVLEREVTLGGDAGVAVGELGQGINAATGLGLSADMYAFARSAGLYIGVSIEGSVISPRYTWNKEFYGQGATPKSILITRETTTFAPSAKALMEAMP